MTRVCELEKYHICIDLIKQGLAFGRFPSMMACQRKRVNAGKEAGGVVDQIKSNPDAEVAQLQVLFGPD